jgi:hypothetical protein
MSESGLEFLNKNLGRLNDEFIGSNAKDWQHWKYPETVGNDTGVDDINFNSHESSEYAINRMNHISTTSSEPFMLFEFMTIDEDKAKAKITAGANDFKVIGALWAGEPRPKDDEGNPIVSSWDNLPMLDKKAQGDEAKGNLKSFTSGLKDSIMGFITNASKEAERNYTGSIALYMPTDIQINDSMVYNEDTRKLGAALNAFASGEDGELINWVTATDPAVLAAVGAGIGALGGAAALTGVITGTVGTLVQQEMQRHTGKIMNPNELVRYQSTGLRSFTFNWTILPDNENESKQAAGLIKFFRKSAHAKRSSSTLVTVPDHVICSFHGGGVKGTEMIQLPPCYIETVNVTYNPNNTSFFKQNNAPVEIGLSVGLKEIVPIYAGDVEKRGY